MKKIGLLLAILVSLVACRPEPAEDRVNVPSTFTVKPTINPSYVYPSLAHPDRDSFLRDAHLNGVNPVSDDDLVEVGATTCNAWYDGKTYAEVRGAMDRTLTTWSQHDKDVVIILSAMYLCPEFDGRYGA